MLSISLECVHRYYESRRRVLLDSQPERHEQKKTNDRKTELSQRQRAVSTQLLISIFFLFFFEFCSHCDVRL